MKGIILVLGAPNSADGQLSEIARNRLDCAKRFYKNNPAFKIICTGGFGPHFNTTATAHAEYAKKYLLENGVPDSAFLELVLSTNTIQDALLAKPLVEKYTPGNIVVITSDFHMKRAALIFTQVFASQNLIFVEALSTLDLAELKKLNTHELKAIERYLTENNKSMTA